jgi:hypothetical protein
MMVLTVTANWLAVGFFLKRAWHKICLASMRARLSDHCCTEVAGAVDVPFL